MSKRKTEPAPDMDLAPEKWPSTTEALRDIANPLARAEELLLALESRCASGETVGLSDIRAVLKALRG